MHQHFNNISDLLNNDSIHFMINMQENYVLMIPIKYLVPIMLSLHDIDLK
jgi:hypothetical protein